MLKEDILERVRADKPVLDRFGVKSIAVFGSFARGEARPDTDLDILVDYRDDARPDLFDFIELKHHLEALFGRPVDLATPEALHRRLRERILAEAVLPERDWRLRIHDITDAIERIQRYTKDMSFGKFQADERTIDAVLRNLEVIGEAAGHVPPEVIDRSREIQWDKMRALRNIRRA